MGGEVQLAFFDLGKLVRKLNSVVDEEEEGHISTEEFEVKEPKRNPFIACSHMWDDRKISVRGKYPLTRTSHGEKFVDALMGDDSEYNMGYVFVETGWLGRGQQYGGTYEGIRFRLKEPLTLKQDDSVREALGLQDWEKTPTELPNCSVRISVEDVNYGSTLKRADHKHYGPIVTSRTSLTGPYGLDLGNVLPTEWFISDDCTRILDQLKADKPTGYELSV